MKSKFGAHTAIASATVPTGSRAIAVVTSAGVMQLSDKEGCLIVDWLL